MKIAPALLTQTKYEYDGLLPKARQMSDRLQYDFVDGKFARNKTVSPQELEPIADMQLDIDMMVERPKEWVNRLTRLRPHLVVFHFECKDDLVDVIGHWVGFSKIGVAINPETRVDEIRHLLIDCDHVLVMGVEAGFSGQPLQERVLPKAAQIRALSKSVEIGIDGGVNSTNLGYIAAAGFDIAYVNSAVFGKEDPVEAFAQLEKVAV